MIVPEMINLHNWSASLIIDFPTDNIPILIRDEEWKEWGNQLIQCDTFLMNNAPGTDGYKEWKEWAEAVFFSMSDGE